MKVRTDEVVQPADVLEAQTPRGVRGNAPPPPKKKKKKICKIGLSKMQFPALLRPELLQELSLFFFQLLHAFHN